MFGKKKQTKIEFDRQTQKPILKCSICTGEQVAGFKDLRTGAFQEVMLIQDRKDLEIFLQTYGLESISKEY